MSNRDPLYSSPLSGSNDPLSPMSDDPLATTPGRTDVPQTEPIDWENDAYIAPIGQGGANVRGESGGSSDSSSDDMKGKAEEKAGQAKDKAADVAGQAQEKAGEAKDKATEMAGQVQDKVGAVGEQVHAKTDAGIDSAASGLEQAAGLLRKQGEQREGAVGTAAAKTADTLETASTYLHEKDTDQVMADLEALVRRKPVESVLVAAGIGYLLSKIVS